MVEVFHSVGHQNKGEMLEEVMGLQQMEMFCDGEVLGQGFVVNKVQI